jgi:hypothetical protein
VDTAAIDRLATGTVRDVLVQQVANMTSAGVVFRGTPVLAPAVERDALDARPPIVWVRDCYDISAVTAARRDTGDPVTLPEQVTRYVATATVTQQADGHWAVTELQPDRKRPC